MDFKFAVLLVISAYICTSQAVPPCICPPNLNPVCGSDGVTYDNQCLLDCANFNSPNSNITTVSQGPCEASPLPAPKECACPLIYLPVCGNDGVTYPNLCSLECEKQHNAGLEVSHPGECVAQVTDGLF